MPATNYYLGLKRGASNNPGNVVAGTSTAGTAVDVEVRLQINDGSNATNLKVIDAVLLLDMLERYIEQRGITGNLGVDIPAS